MALVIALLALLLRGCGAHIWNETVADPPCLSERLVEVIKGESAYQVWLDQGNTGTEQDFLNALIGDPGPDGYQGIPGPLGPIGKSAYQIWLDEGNAGSPADFIEALKGSAGNDGDDGSSGTDGEDGSPGEPGTPGIDGCCWATRETSKHSSTRYRVKPEQQASREQRVRQDQPVSQAHQGPRVHLARRVNQGSARLAIKALRVIRGHRVRLVHPALRASRERAGLVTLAHSGIPKFKDLTEPYRKQWTLRTPFTWGSRDPQLACQLNRGRAMLGGAVLTSHLLILGCTTSHSQHSCCALRGDRLTR